MFYKIRKVTKRRGTEEVCSKFVILPSSRLPQGSYKIRIYKPVSLESVLYGGRTRSLSLSNEKHRRRCKILLGKYSGGDIKRNDRESFLIPLQSQLALFQSRLVKYSDIAGVHDISNIPWTRASNEPILGALGVLVEINANVGTSLRNESGTKCLIFRGKSYSVLFTTNSVLKKILFRIYFLFLNSNIVKKET